MTCNLGTVIKVIYTYSAWSKKKKGKRNILRNSRYCVHRNCNLHVVVVYGMEYMY